MGMGGQAELILRAQAGFKGLEHGALAFHQRLRRGQGAGQKKLNVLNVDFIQKIINK